MNCNGFSPVLLGVILFFMGAASACTSGDLAPQRQGRPVEVGFYAGDPQTRTSIDSDGLSTSWSEDDQIAVWAKKSTGTLNLNNKKFILHALDGRRAFFTTTLDEPMSEGDYTYYAVYPLPKGVSGTTVTFDLPSVQDGVLGAGSEIMIARPQEHGALECLPEVEDHSSMSMTFSHLLHMLKFYVPQDETGFDSDVTRLLLDMPFAVTGTVSADYTGETAPALSDGVSGIEVNCARPAGVSTSAARNYICASIFPKVEACSSGDFLNVTAYTATTKYSMDPVSLEGRSFVSGHATPAALRPVSSQPYYRVICKVHEDYIGETVNFFTISSGGESLYTHTNDSGAYRDFTTDEELLGESYDSWFQQLCTAVSSGSATVSFDTPNTISEVRLPSGCISVNGHTAVIDLGDVPYLLFENFDNALSYKHSDDYSNSIIGISEGIDINNDMDTNGYLLNGYMPDNGWNAARFCLIEGDKIRINVRYQSGGWVVGRYCGRLDTPALARIKQGKSVTVKLQFDYSFLIPEGMNTSDVNNKVAYLRIAKHTNSMNSATNGTTQGNVPSGVWESEKNASGSVAAMQHADVTITGCGPTTRITFWPLTTRDSSKIAANCVYYVYLDDIRIYVDN